MTPLPDLTKLTSEQKDALIVALWEQVQKLSLRVDELEARLNEPPKNSGNSSMPASKGFKGNKSKDTGKSERTGPRQGSLGRKGHHRPLAENPDEIVRVMAKQCSKCCGALREEDQALVDAYDKIDIPEVKPHVTRVEIYEGICSCCACATMPSIVSDRMEKGSLRNAARLCGRMANLSRPSVARLPLCD